jgi:hypothetical protein
MRPRFGYIGAGWLRLAVLAVAALAFSSAAGLSQGHAAEKATITGHVFWDANADGKQEVGERGIQTKIYLVNDFGAAGAGETDAAGNYRIEIAPGTYRARPDIVHTLSLCVDSLLATNSPFPRGGGCSSVPFPITSPEDSEPFTVTAGATREEDFAVAAKDQMVIIALAVQEQDHAPAGSTITARVRGKACGSVVVPPGGGGQTFVLYVEGATSAAGCAAPGDTVEFESGGVKAREAVKYDRFVPGPAALSPYYAGGVEDVDMAFSEDWMWLWSDNLTFADGSAVPEGTRIVAKIGQAGCGVGINANQLNGPGGSTGFRQLFVPSERISIGCGKAGAQVDLVAILLDRDELLASFPWEPGVKQIGGAALRPPPTPPATAEPTATPEGTINLPNTGAGPGHGRGDWFRGFLLASIGAASAAMWLGVRRLG